MVAFQNPCMHQHDSMMDTLKSTNQRALSQSIKFYPHYGSETAHFSKDISDCPKDCFRCHNTFKMYGKTSTRKVHYIIMGHVGNIHQHFQKLTISQFYGALLFLTNTNDRKICQTV